MAISDSPNTKPDWLALAEARATKDAQHPGWWQTAARATETDPVPVRLPEPVSTPEPPAPWWRERLDRDAVRASSYVGWSAASARAKAKPVDLVISWSAAQKIDQPLIERLEQAGVRIYLGSASPAIARYVGDQVEVQPASDRRIRHSSLLAGPVRSERNAMAGRVIAYLQRHPRAKYARMIVSTHGARVGIDGLERRINDAMAAGRLMAMAMEKAGTEVIFSSLEITFCEKTQSFHAHKNWIIIEHHMPMAAERSDFYRRIEKVAGGRVQQCGRLDGVSRVVHRDGKTIVERDKSRAGDLSRGIAYVVKYVTKGDDLLAMPLKTLAKYAEIMEGRHRFQTYGDFRLWSAAVVQSGIRYRSIGRLMVPVRVPDRGQPTETDRAPDGDNIVLAIGFQRGPDSQPLPSATVINHQSNPQGERGRERLDYVQWWMEVGSKLWLAQHDAGQRPPSPWRLWRELIEETAGKRLSTMSSTNARQKFQARAVNAPSGGKADDPPIPEAPDDPF